MSIRFWMLSGATLGTAAALGLGLGFYVTSPQAPAVRGEEVEATSLAAGFPPSEAPVEPGPAQVRCIGCGPTLEERRRAAEMAGLDADGMIGESRDPVVQDYLAQPESVADAAPAPPAAHRLPPQIERFATGDAASPPMVAPTATMAPPLPAPMETREAGLPQ